MLSVPFSKASKKSNTTKTSPTRATVAPWRGGRFDPRQLVSAHRGPSRLTLTVAASTVLAAALTAGLAVAWPVSAAADQAGPTRIGVAHLTRSALTTPRSERSKSASKRQHPSLTTARQGAARHQELQSAAQGSQQQAATQQAAAGSASQPAGSPPVATGTPQQIALAMLANYGWSQDQFSCLDALWTEESGWNVYAANPSSGAYGIPQALPGSKMASAGPDWQTDAATQIAWGLGYIQATYGSPCGAWEHEQAYGWY